MPHAVQYNRFQTQTKIFFKFEGARKMEFYIRMLYVVQLPWYHVVTDMKVNDTPQSPANV